MSEPIDEIKKRMIKKEIQQAELEDMELENQVAEYKGHKIEQINPINSRTRDLFKGVFKRT